MKVQTITRPSIGIAVVEDDPIRLIGLRSALDQDVVSRLHLIATSISAIAAERSVDIVILRSSEPNFTETIATLRGVRPDLSVVVTGTGSDDETVLKAMAAGAKGYVDEAAPTRELVEAIYSVHRGSIWIPRRIMSMFIERSVDLLRGTTQFGSCRLTSREKEVLEMLVEGRSNKEIGSPLGIEVRTVKAHVARLMHKVGVKNRIALSVHAVRHSLVSTQ
jgi:DNA-binding NarL/FixJ family response regulator